MVYAQFVATALALLACAISVFAAWKASSLASKLRSMTSLQGELIEIRDYCSKIDAWSKRLNARLTMQERRSGGDTPLENLDPAALKARLRRIAGIVPGRAVKHGE